MSAPRKTGGVYLRGETWWIHYRVDGRRYYESADTRDERAARSFLAQRRRELAEGAWRPPGEPEPAATVALTLRAWAATWLARRREAGVRTVGHEERRITAWWLPALGDVELAAITRAQVRDVVATMQRSKSETTGKPYSPREVLHVYAALRTCLADAVIEEVLAVSPCTLRTRRGELPVKRDADPTWREGAVYSREEAETLISDERLPIDRRVRYALMLFLGLRAGEANGLRWSDYDREARPLGRMLVVRQAEGDEERETKTQRTRRVPVHPTLAALLAEWRMSGFPAVFLRHPRSSDYIAPSRRGTDVARTHAAGGKMIEDLERLGLRASGRRQHALRATFRSLAIEDGAIPEILDAAMWGAGSDVRGGYERFPWAARCAEVAKLRVVLRRPSVVQLRRAANENGPPLGDSRGDSQEGSGCFSAESAMEPRGIEPQGRGGYVRISADPRAQPSTAPWTLGPGNEAERIPSTQSVTQSVTAREREGVSMIGDPEIDTLLADRDRLGGVIEKQRRALENIRMLAMRMRRTAPEEAEHLLRFCREAGVVGSVMRESDGEVIDG